MDDRKKVNIWYLLRFLKAYFWPVFFTMVFLILGRVAASFDPIWLKLIIDGVEDNNTFAMLTTPIIIYFSIRAVTYLFDYLRDVIFAPTEMGIARTLSRELYHHLLTLPVKYHHDQKIGGLARQITRGGRAITFILDFLVINILPTFIELIIVTFLLFKLYDPIYALVTFGTIVIYTIFTIWSTEKRQKYRLQANIADDEVSAMEVDTLSNIDTVKYFNNESYLQKEYEPLIEKRYGLTVASNKLFALISGGQGLILLIGLGIILVLGVRQATLGILTIGDLVLLTTYITRLSSPIGVLGFVYRQIKDGIADLDGMARILQEEINVKDPEKASKITSPKGKIEFKDVSFGYEQNRLIYKNLDFTVKPGEKVAFVGPSGVGKSTVVKLLFRIYDPTAGGILVDGVDLRKISKKQRQNIFAIVPQEPALFNSTIEENIRFGKPDATDKEIRGAAKLASIDSFIQELPDKYKTLVGERGVKLSGGEKQRVAIARAIVRDPLVLVFDEATSSLDSRNEKEIQKALDKVSKGRTTLAVAHRLSTIINSDQIFVLNKGEIVEKGTHKELISKEGLYKKLWDMQAGEKQSLKYPSV